MQRLLNNIPISLFCSILSVILSACGGNSGSPPMIGNSSSSEPAAEVEARSFRMGFTPWPYAATQNALNDTYSKIQDNGNIVAHHFLGGVPWQETFSAQAYHANVESELSTRLSLTQSNKRIYLAIDSLNSDRSGLTLNWAANEGEPRPIPWDTRDFDSPEVITAYTNFALDLISRFNPDYFNYASEISTLAQPANAVLFDKFVIFAQQVHTNIKAAYPNLPLIVSIDLKSPGSVEMLAVTTQFARIANYVDMIGVSVYPYAFYGHSNKGNPDTLPSNWLSQINTIAPNKPIAITETGWTAEDISIPAFGLNENSSASNQNTYLTKLFEQADILNAAFIILFSIVDYDDLWTNSLGKMTSPESGVTQGFMMIYCNLVSD